MAVDVTVQPVDFSDLYVSGQTPEESVNANLVSQASFEQIKRALAPKGFAELSSLRKMQLLIATLAFRCGLRRSEALHLKVTDLHLGPKPELFDGSFELNNIDLVK